MVNSLKMTDANYPIVWEKLNNQFDNPRLSAEILVDRIINFRKLNFETVAGLMDFLHVFDKSLQSLGVLNIEDLPGFILFVLANKTLPSVTRELFERDTNADFPVIEDLVSFVKCRIKILENVVYLLPNLC